MHICAMHHSYMCLCSYHTFFDGYCSTVQGLLDWFEVGFTERTHVRKKKIAFARAYVCHDKKKKVPLLVPMCAMTHSTRDKTQ